jgi:hypothetical protein
VISTTTVIADDEGLTQRVNRGRGDGNRSVLMLGFAVLGPKPLHALLAPVAGESSDSRGVGRKVGADANYRKHYFARLIEWVTGHGLI